MKKTLVICGPTGTGKTNLALHIASKIPSEILSADSRQVFKGMDIGTGKDLPRNSKNILSDIFFNNKRVGYYKIGEINLWGYDLIKPNEDFNVYDFVTVGREIIKQIWEKDKLPIVVGGTGLYIKALVDGLDMATTGPDEKLRSQLKGHSAVYLFELLNKHNPKRAQQMNLSDRQNPRRLIRALELSINNQNITKTLPPLSSEVLFIGLDLPLHKQSQKIYERVIKRIKEGQIDEIQKLISEGISWEDKSLSALGYKQWQSFFEEGVGVEQVINMWYREELKYAKRQKTWFKKDPRIHWYVANQHAIQEVEKEVLRWYY